MVAMREIGIVTVGGGTVAHCLSRRPRQREITPAASSPPST
jgi:hypothetical protein